MIKQKFVIAFKDGDTEHYYKKENHNKEGEFLGYGEVIYFETEPQAEKYLRNNTDSRAYDFYIKKVKGGIRKNGTNGN